MVKVIEAIGAMLERNQDADEVRRSKEVVVALAKSNDPTFNAFGQGREDMWPPSSGVA